MYQKIGQNEYKSNNEIRMNRIDSYVKEKLNILESEIKDLRLAKKKRVDDELTRLTRLCGKLTKFACDDIYIEDFVTEDDL